MQAKDLKNLAESMTAHCVYLNYDSNEGRGPVFPWAICGIEVTARRLAKGKGVQGGDADVRQVPLFKIDNIWYGPVNIEASSDADMKEHEKRKAEQALNEKVQIILARARALGLSEEEINLLKA